MATSIVTKCISCGKEFEITQGEHNFYTEHGYKLPRRCKECRDYYKQSVEKIVCSDCGEEFDLSAKEKEFYEKRGLSLPKRCKECRAKRRNGGTADGQPESAENKPEESAEGK